MKTNKSIILEVIKNIFLKQDADAIKALVKENYIQHSPMVKDGRDGLIEAIAYLKSMPKSGNPTPPLVRMLADGAYVATLMEIHFEGARKAVVDLYRLEDGMVAEHWDVVQDLGHEGLFFGTITEETVNSNAEVNKEISARFFREVFIGKSYASLPGFVDDDLINHFKKMSQGQKGLLDFLQNGSFIFQKPHRIIGEGSLVMLQAEGMIDSIPSVFYLLFRVYNLKISELWILSQQMPEVSLNSNGML